MNHRQRNRDVFNFHAGESLLDCCPIVQVIIIILGVSLWVIYVLTVADCNGFEDILLGAVVDRITRRMYEFRCSFILRNWPTHNELILINESHDLQIIVTGNEDAKLPRMSTTRTLARFMRQHLFVINILACVLFTNVYVFILLKIYPFY